MRNDYTLNWLAIGVIVIALLLLTYDIRQVKKSVAKTSTPSVEVKVEAPAPVVREKYFRGDIVKLANGAEAWISDKSNNNTSKAWHYQINAVGMKGHWVPEGDIQSVIHESPTKPKAEK